MDPSPPRNRRRERLDRRYVHGVVDDVFGPNLHELRVLSLANGVTGVMNAAVLSLPAIGQSYAVEEMQKHWAPYVVGERNPPMAW